VGLVGEGVRVVLVVVGVVLVAPAPQRETEGGRYLTGLVLLVLDSDREWVCENRGGLVRRFC